MCDEIVVPIKEWDPDFFSWLLAETAEENILDSVLFGGDGSEQVENYG